jgi:hemoglobin
VLVAGERAELAKAHAARVARAFHARLEGYEPAAPAAAGLVVTHRRAPR